MIWEPQIIPEHTQRSSWEKKFNCPVCVVDAKINSDNK